MDADSFKKAAISAPCGLHLPVTFQVASLRIYLLFFQEISAFIGALRRLLKDLGRGRVV
jgi:hypothetical protein